MSEPEVIRLFPDAVIFSKRAKGLDRDFLILGQAPGQGLKAGDGVDVLLGVKGMEGRGLHSGGSSGVNTVQVATE
jgi:hypothetical protein